MEEQLRKLQAEMEAMRQMMQQQAAQAVEQAQNMNHMQSNMQQAISRAERAESKRSDVLKIAAKLAGSSGGDLVDTRGVGQPCKFSVKRDQDFSEWDHKFRTSKILGAKYGPDIQ